MVLLRYGLRTGLRPSQGFTKSQLGTDEGLAGIRNGPQLDRLQGLSCSNSVPTPNTSQILEMAFREKYWLSSLSRLATNAIHSRDATAPIRALKSGLVIKDSLRRASTRAINLRLYSLSSIFASRLGRGPGWISFWLVVILGFSSEVRSQDLPACGFPNPEDHLNL